MTRPNSSLRIEAVCRRLATDGPAALPLLIDLAEVRLVNFATTITRNQHDGEDAVQAAMVKLATRPDRLGRCAKPWAYLLRMVRNEALMILRRTRRVQYRDSLIDLRTERRVDELEQEEIHRAVWLALRQIPTQQSEVIVLKMWESLTFAEIAEVLDVPADTAASRYRYGMRKLTGLLRQSMGESSHAEA